MGAGVVRATATSTATKVMKIAPVIRYVVPIVLGRIRILPIEVRSRKAARAVGRQDHDEAAAPPALRRAARLAPVPPRNLPHQSEPQPRARDLFGSGAAVERVEHALALRLRNARAVVAGGQFR